MNCESLTCRHARAEHNGPGEHVCHVGHLHHEGRPSGHCVVAGCPCNAFVGEPRRRLHAAPRGERTIVRNGKFVTHGARARNHARRVA